MNVRGGLTNLYARISFGSWVERSQYSVRDIDTEVYWMDSDSSAKGHCTPFQTLLLNESELPNDELAKDYVVIHEIGHKQSPLWMYLASWFIRVPLLLLIAAVIPTAIGQILGHTISLSPLPFLATLTLAQLILITFLIVPFVALSWYDEGYAEVFALRKMGREDFDEARERLKSNSERSLFWRVVRPLIYPPDRLVSRFGVGQ